MNRKVLQISGVDLGGEGPTSSQMSREFGWEVWFQSVGVRFRVKMLWNDICFRWSLFSVLRPMWASLLFVEMFGTCVMDMVLLLFSPCPAVHSSASVLQR